MGEEIRIRLDFFKDNIMIDYIGIDNDLTPDDFKTVDLTPTKILLNQRDATEEIMNAISDIDEKYLITDPGDKINLNYEIENREDQQITFFIESNGYYKEWIRGNWITNNNSNYIFNLADIQGTIRQLQSSWIENREIIEAEFFRTRVPLKGKMP
jgi:primase-polymerase (primpol)-like protein